MKIEDLINSAVNDDNAALLLVARLKLRISISEGCAWADPICAAMSTNPIPIGDDASTALRSAIVDTAKWVLGCKAPNE